VGEKADEAGEWLRFVVAVIAWPVIALDDVIHHARYRAWEAAQRQQRLDRYEGE
jgi:hypothetical protein